MNAREEPGVVAKVAARIVEIAAADWDACANPDPAAHNPFLSHAFLNALEASGCVGDRRTGWLPHHITLTDAAGGIAACMPCYVKLHSAGEYVFDYAWAEAYERAGGTYYPKLQVAVPFTPVPGRRLLVRPGPDEDRRQIDRWKKIRRHIRQIEKNCERGDLACRPRQRQAVLHWAYDSRKI